MYSILQIVLEVTIVGVVSEMQKKEAGKIVHRAIHLGVMLGKD